MFSDVLVLRLDFELTIVELEAVEAVVDLVLLVLEGS